MRIFRLISTRSVVTSFPSTITPGVTIHRPAPIGHGLVVVVADFRVLERAPAAEQDAAPAHLLVAGQRLVEEIEEIVVQRHALSS